MKKIFSLLTIFCCVTLFYSCGSDDDDNGIDEEWKAYNESLLVGLESKGYKALQSQSKNGSVYWKNIDFIAETTKSLSTRITKGGTPYSTDSIAIRYEGRVYRTDGSEYIFDTTEGDYNGKIYRGRVNAFVDGFSTMLQDMKKGDQVEVCIPYQLGYGAAGKSPIPGYSTLWFKIMLVDIIPDKPDEFK